MQRRKKGIFEEIEANRAVFTAAFLGLFTIVFLFLSVMGLTPEPFLGQSYSQGESVLSGTQSSGEYPVRIVASDIGLDFPVNNPTTTDIETLDHSLLSGTVRYPTSGLLGRNGTVLLFGHSSTLPVVSNQAYKVFTDIRKFKEGAIIRVYSQSHEYRYAVTGVYNANAAVDSIALPDDGQYLTLVTCDTFGQNAQKTKRFVVTAKLVGAYSLTN